MITANDIDYSTLKKFPLSEAISKKTKEPEANNGDGMSESQFIELCQTIAALNHAERCQVARYITKQRIDAFTW